MTPRFFVAQPGFICAAGGRSSELWRMGGGTAAACSEPPSSCISISTGAADTRTGVDDPGLASFRAGIAAGAPVVMMSSAVYERIDPDNRALFSRAVVTDLLQGVIDEGTA